MRRVLVMFTLLGLVAATAYAQEPEPSSPPAKQPVTNPITKRSNSPQKMQIIGSRGSLFVKVNTWDFGHVAQDAKVTHRFEVQNVGKDTLFIDKIKPT